MIDIIGFLIWIGSFIIKRLVFLFALIAGIIYTVKQKKLGDYFYSLGYGNDLFGAKLIAPFANKHFIKQGGKKYGTEDNKTISYYMAINKRYGFNTPAADWWERRINFFDKNHLEKTLKKHNL